MRTVARTPLDRSNLPTVNGKIAFAQRSPSEHGLDTSVMAYDPGAPQVIHDLTIRDARPIAEQLSLDKEGFILVDHATSCGGIAEPSDMTKQYLQEMTPFIKDFFAASRVVAKTDAVLIRSTREAEAGQVGYASYNAHFDYAPVSAPMLAAQDSQKQGIPIEVYSRMMIIQAWRVLSPPPQDLPLAFADASTITQNSILEHSYRSPRGGGWRSVMIHHDPSIQWYYFSQMHRDEVILFKGYDSDTHYAARAAHSGFDNRRAFPNAIPRRSVEARFYVYFD